MCTVTWLIKPDPEKGESYDLLFNRDELKTRLPALPLESHEGPAGTDYLCATDADHGGTWLFVNSRGLTVGILNFYAAQANWKPQPDMAGKVQSRGHLVLSFVDCADAQAVEADLTSRQLAPYRPFHLLAISPSMEPKFWTWDGTNLEATASPSSHLPFTTSSHATESVLAARRERFREENPQSLGALETYHREFDPKRGAHSVCMMRPDAQTWSISHIRVDPGRIQYDYLARGLEELDFQAPLSRQLVRS